MKSFRVKDLMINVSPCTACTLSCNAQPTLVPALVCGPLQTLCRPGNTCGPCTNVCTHEQCTNISCGVTCACSALCTNACTGGCSGVCTYICTHFCTQAATCAANCTQITCHERFSCAVGVPTVAEAEPQASLEALGTLKQQLQQQLAALEQQEQAMTAALKPQTVSQVDQLMQKLQEAMDDLKTQRADLVKKEAQDK